jgi:hypothetical protein
MAFFCADLSIATRELAYLLKNPIITSPAVPDRRSPSQARPKQGCGNENLLVNENKESTWVG